MLDLVPISETGYNKLKEELKELEKERVVVGKRVSDAREQGDLKENGEYIYGRQQLGFIEGRLGELRGMINKSEVVDCTKVECDKALFGTIVTLKNLNTNDTVKWQLLGPFDADFETSSISIDSPVGDAILGLSKGEIATANVPAGELSFEVLDIAKSEVK